MRIQIALLAASLLFGVLLVPLGAAAAADSRFELSVGFAFNHTNYGGDSYSWTRRWGFGAGYHLTDLSEIEFAFQDVIDRTKITGYEDTTFHDRIYSINWVQSFLPKTSFLQPYIKGGVGQLNREATGEYAGGGKPSSRVDSLTAVLGLGARIFITRSLALRVEATSYLTGARIATWRDNYAFQVGGSISFSSLILATTLAAFSGCGTIQYLVQAGKGQLELSNRARPIPEVVADERTPTRIRALLAELGPIKRFGEDRGIKPTSNYMDYVALDRRAAVWVVSACEPLRFEAKEWKFPIVGGFPYLGWFDIEDARKYASKLRKEGFDVDLRGAAAYSTLGWFRDAVLSTMIPEGQEALGELVNVILHESVHATVYVNGQAFFNESLASFVADRMTPQYLAATRGAGSAELLAFEKAEVSSRARARRMHLAYGELEKLYASAKSEQEKRSEKEKLLSALKTELGYQREINNATLIQYKEYHEGTEEYDELLKACGGDWKRFLSSVAKLTPKSFARPQQEELAPVVLPLAKAGC